MKLAEYQDLYYVKKVDFGVYLAEDMGGVSGKYIRSTVFWQGKS